MKKCKQCGRMLEDDQFRPTKSRSNGIYKTTKLGSSSICRSCESLNVRAHKALKDCDEAAIEKLRTHYQKLQGIGLPPVTAAAKKLLGIVSPSGMPIDKAETNKALNYDYELLAHAEAVRNRTYTSVDEADAVHKRLAERLKQAGLYAEISDLLDDWFMDE